MPAEQQPVTVTVNQQPASQSAQSSVPSFLSQPKPAEPAPAAPQPVGPAQPAMAPATGDAGLPPVVVHTGRKSRTLLIVIVLVLLLAGGGAAAYFLTRKDSPASQSANTNTQSNDGESTDEPAQDQPTEVPAITAQNTSDFDAVCDGKAISNAAAYTDNKSAVIYTFRNKPTTPDSWSSILVGYGKSYYLEDLDKFTELNTVACLKFDAGDAGQGIQCEYTSSGQAVTVTYKPLTYTMTIREAKTGKQIGDTQKIDGPAKECPSSVLYDQATKTAYADPDEDAIEAAFDKFVQQ
jgi:hypothetical protein